MRNLLENSLDIKTLVWFFFQRTFAGHLLTKVSVGKIYDVICSILQALLLMVYFLQIAILHDFTLF